MKNNVPHTVVRCLLFVDAYLFSMNSAAVQSTLPVHAYRTSQHRLVTLRRIVYTLLVVSHHWVGMYCFVLTDFSPILMTSLVVLLTTLSIHIVIAP